VRAPRARFLDDRLLYLLSRASHQASEQFHGRLRALGIAVPHWHVLASLAAGEPMTISTLARAMLYKQPTLTKVIDRMEKLGLVERRASVRDRRQVLVRITRRGRGVASRLLKRAKAHEAEVLAGYGRAEALELKTALRTLIRRLGDGAR
jgi:DNA-binding MarR family transcriptional regulator